jgi:cytochrome c biogenesis protein CcmG/thiol:disulfide interchange protein DsbE
MKSAGKIAPSINLPLLEDEKNWNNQSLSGQKYVINFFASWCVPCVAEHEFLNELKNTIHIPMIGVVYKDKKHNAEKFLQKHGSPYKQVVMDEKGRTAIDWGVAGVPETFLIDERGVIAAHFSGPLSAATWQSYFTPFLDRQDLIIPNGSRP